MSRRSATGAYSEFEWGKYDKRRKAMWTADSFSVVNPVLSDPDGMSVARDYPNLTRAYFEALGATVKTEDPIRPQEQTKAIYDFHYLRSEYKEQREATEKREREWNFTEDPWADWGQSSDEE